MADNVAITPGAGASIATDDIGGVNFQRVKLTLGADGANDGDVASGNPLPVTGPLTDAQLRATPVPVSGTVTITDGSGPVTVDGTVGVSGSVAVTGPLTDAQLRASSVPTRIASYNYPISTANSSTAQLTAGSTFTGTWESPQDLPSISILLTSDQPTTITVRQAIDAAGTFRAPDIVFFVRANEGFARSFGINGNFVQILAQNTGASTTTTFNLNVAFGVLGDADSNGILPVTELPLVLTGQAAQTATVNNILTPTAGANAINVSGYRTASVQVVSTGTGGTFIFEQSLDNVNWVALPVFNAALVTGVPITAAITATASQIIYTFPIRGNFLRLRIASLITGGSIQAFTRISTEPWTPSAALVASNTAANLQATVSGTVTANLGAATTRAGFIAAAGIWYDDSSATLAGNATFTGTSRDATVTATATAIANAGAYVDEIRISAESDVTGTLWLEVSRDNTNWRRAKSVATTAVTGGGFYAEIIHRPSWRYWRVGYTNGATIQARFSIGSIAQAA